MSCLGRFAIHFGLFSIALFFALVFPSSLLAAKGPEIRAGVLSKYALNSVVLKGDGLQIWGVDTGGGRRRVGPSYDVVTVRVQGSQVVVEGSNGFAQLRIHSVGPITVEGGSALVRRFSGELRLEARAGVLRFVESLPLESYVRGVLAGELTEDFPIEAQKAQAVLIRSYALAHRGRHAEEGFDFCDLTHCQVYSGAEVSSGIREEAVRATRSLVMSHEGKPIEALFHSTCGGHTSANQRVFGGRPLPYLQGADDGEYCAASPHYLWSSRIPLEKISAVLAEDERLRASIPLRGLSVGDREPEGRVFSLRLEGPRQMEISAMDFLSKIGKAVGWNQLKSNWFDLQMESGVVEFRGRGLGHGVGLCQWGARGMALNGSRFDEILRHYFPGAKMRRLQ